MLYLISFLEGIITFISPCMLPMLPIYISYFAGSREYHSTFKTLKNAVGFVTGFTVIFLLLGAFAGTVGGFLLKYRTWVDIITGLVVVFFGLNYIGVFKLNIFKGMNNPFAGKEQGFASAFLMGIVFSVGWTPCVGAFLGSALMMASGQGNAVEGLFMLLAYSVGLGIPFVVSAVLIDKLKSTFDFIKRHYNVINLVCGILLILVGVLMMSGLMSRYFALFS